MCFKLLQMLNISKLTYFSFSDEWRSRWVNSKHKSDYGEWKLTAGNFYGDAEKDKGKPLTTLNPLNEKQE